MGQENQPCVIHFTKVTIPVLYVRNSESVEVVRLLRQLNIFLHPAFVVPLRHYMRYFWQYLNYLHVLWNYQCRLKTFLFDCRRHHIDDGQENLTPTAQVIPENDIEI